MRSSHAAARKYALIMSIRLLVATDPDHGKLTKMLWAMSSYLQGSMVPYCMSVARFFNLHTRTETMAAPSILPQCVQRGAR